LIATSYAAVRRTYEDASRQLSQPAQKALRLILKESYGTAPTYGPLVLLIRPEPFALWGRIELWELIPALDELLECGLLEGREGGYLWDPDRAESRARAIRGAGR
jgi:hypothetical protein